VIASIPSTAGLKATHPELSPDGTALANVETTGGSFDYVVNDGSIVTRSFDAATNQFGAIRMLVANAANAANYYPSYSPDGQWILSPGRVGGSNGARGPEIGAVRPAGSRPPIHLDHAMAGSAGLTNSWARWTPFAQPVGAMNEPLFFITF